MFGEAAHPTIVTYRSAMSKPEAGSARESVPVVVVGAGPAGLASAACLGERGVDYLVLERNERVGSAWRRHYERLHLHTNKGSSELPGLSFPGGTGRYPSRQAVVDYLEAYADRFGIEPRFGVEVTSIARDGEGGWRVCAGDSEIDCRCVVITTGFTRVPNRPSWPGLDGFEGEVIHSSEYKNGEPYRGKRVLVVGFGNSGGEIAICLHEHGARPGIAVRGPVNVVPRDILGMPILAVGISMAWMPPAVADALAYPLLLPTFRRAKRAGLKLHGYGVFAQIKNDLRIPLLDIGTIDLMLSRDLTLHRGVERFDGGEVVFADGSRDRFDAVVLATGYKARVDQFLDAPDGVLDGDGRPRVSGKPIPGVPGLFFSGFYLAPTGMLREIGLEAPAIAEAVAASLRA